MGLEVLGTWLGTNTVSSAFMYDFIDCQPGTIVYR